jgi:UDP-2,3-diacylglucosamine pyrophosphatase LpxH
MVECIRPRLYGDTIKWAEIIESVRAIGLDESLKLFEETSRLKDANVTFDTQNNTLTSSKSERIKNLDDLILLTNLDTDKWEVERHTVNSWEQNSVERGLVTLYQVKAFLRLRGLEAPDQTWTTKWLNALVKDIPKLQPIKLGSNTNQPLVVVISDLHIGAIMQGDRLIEDYNVNICVEKLEQIASYVNAKKQPVYIVMLGDIIESFTGKNKQDTWKQIELHGAKAALTAFDVLWHFLSSLHSLKGMYLIGGNHDRITDDKKDDNQSQVMELLYGMFKRMTTVNVEYDPLILTPMIDDIQYLFMHGDKLIKKKNAAEIVLDYGEQTLFNLLVSGHLHSRIVRQDKLRFRDITVPSIVTGSNYEMSKNWNSLSGFITIESLDGKPIITDIPL